MNFYIGSLFWISNSNLLCISLTAVCKRLSVLLLSRVCASHIHLHCLKQWFLNILSFRYNKGKPEFEATPVFICEVPSSLRHRLFWASLLAYALHASP